LCWRRRGEKYRDKNKRAKKRILIFSQKQKWVYIPTSKRSSFWPLILELRWCSNVKLNAMLV
jgi:hypothetical protein